ncbi:Mitochondrial import inner membrane translocase subunit tim23, partial [Nowakowskiella sp. JEL0078]
MAFFGFFGKPADSQNNPVLDDSNASSSNADPKSTKPVPSNIAKSASLSSLQTETVSSMLGNVKVNQEKFLGLENGIEYLTIEENPFMQEAKNTGSFGPFPMRNDTDKMMYGTGIGYLIGISSGGLYGIIRGLRSSKGQLYKLRVNSVLNATTR